MNRPIITFEQRAHALQHQWIEEGDGEVRLAPIVPNGISYEFQPRWVAVKRLHELEAEAGYSPEDEQ